MTQAYSEKLFRNQIKEQTKTSHVIGKASFVLSPKENRKRARELKNDRPLLSSTPTDQVKKRDTRSVGFVVHKMKPFQSFLCSFSCRCCHHYSTCNPNPELLISRDACQGGKLCFEIKLRHCFDQRTKRVSFDHYNDYVTFSYFLTVQRI